MTARLGMNAVMDLIGQGPNSQADLKSLKEKLSARIDAILAAGKNIEEPGDITTLQSCIGKIIAVPCYIFAGANTSRLRICLISSHIIKITN